MQNYSRLQLVSSQGLKAIPHTSLSEDKIGVYANTPVEPTSDSFSLPVIVDLPNNKEVGTVSVNNLTTSNGNNYVEIKITLKSSNQVNRQMETFNINILQDSTRGDDYHFYFEIEGNKKKVIAANTAVHPKNNDL